jgi:hypothetical protein
VSSALDHSNIWSSVRNGRQVNNLNFVPSIHVKLPFYSL